MILLLGCTGETPPAPDVPWTFAPTVEGFGADTVGGDGAGAAAVVVTSLADDGEGSLRAALAAVRGPTAITFAVGGDLVLEQPILLPSDVTIDGAAGVTLVGNGLHLIDGAQVVVRDLAFRDIVGPGDAFTIERSTDVLVDHCAFDNGGLDPSIPDEFIAVVWGSTRVTIAWSRFANTDKVFLFGNGDASAEIDGAIAVTLHDNVLTDNGRRHPFVRYGRVDEYNTLIADWSLRHTMTYGARVADGGRLLLHNDWVEQHSEEAPLTASPELAMLLAGSTWIGAVAETDDARIDVQDVTVTDERVLLEHTGDAFERPYPATIRPLDAAWRAGIEAAVGPRW